MKKYVLSLAIVSALLFVTTNIQAQSWADLFKKENIEKVVNAVTGNNAIDMTGTWTYSGSAIEFESDNLLQKAGGAAAASLAENKLNEQLAKVGQRHVHHARKSGEIGLIQGYGRNARSCGLQQHSP